MPAPLLDKKTKQNERKQLTEEERGGVVRRLFRVVLLRTVLHHLPRGCVFVATFALPFSFFFLIFEYLVFSFFEHLGSFIKLQNTLKRQELIFKP